MLPAWEAAPGRGLGFRVQGLMFLGFGCRAGADGGAASPQEGRESAEHGAAGAVSAAGVVSGGDFSLIGADFLVDKDLNVWS